MRMSAWSVFLCPLFSSPFLHHFLVSPFPISPVPMLQQLETSLRNRSVPQPPHFLGGSLSANNSAPSPYNRSAFATSPLPVATPAYNSSSGRSLETPLSSASAPAQSAQHPQSSSSNGGGSGITAAPAPAPSAPVLAPAAPVSVPLPSPSPPSSTSAQGPSSTSSADSAAERERQAKQQLHAEISREFAAIMAAGGLDASAAAAAALQRVMARHAAAATAATATAGGAVRGSGNAAK